MLTWRAYLNARILMDTQAIESLIRDGLSQCELELSADGNKISLIIVSDDFSGLNRVKRQQRVYALLDEKIKSGEIHAVSMTTKTREEAANG